MTSTYQTQIEDTTYNGWTNYETWNVALWIGNDEFLYDVAKDMARRSIHPYAEFVVHMKEIYNMQETPDGVSWDDDSLNICELDEMMEEL